MKNEERAIMGGGIVLGGTGLATVSGATGTGFIANVITSIVTAAPAAGKFGIMLGSIFSSTLIAPVVIGGGLVLIAISAIKTE